MTPEDPLSARMSARIEALRPMRESGINPTVLDPGIAVIPACLQASEKMTPARCAGPRRR
jgi:hypothetical protein